MPALRCYLLSFICSQKLSFKRFVIFVGTAEEHLKSKISVLYVVVALGVVTLSPNAEGDLLRLELVEVEEAGIVREALGYVKGGLTVDRGALVGLPDSRRAAVLIGYAYRADDVSLGAGVCRGAGCGGILALYLYRLTGEMDPHISRSYEPYLELDECIVVSAAGATRPAREGDAVRGGDGIEQLLIQSRRVLRSESGIYHVVGERLLPKSHIGRSAVLDIKIELRRCADLEVDIVDSRKVGERKPSQCRCYQNQHGYHAEQECKLALNARLCLLQFFKLLTELLHCLFFHTAHHHTNTYLVTGIRKSLIGTLTQ